MLIRSPTPEQYGAVRRLLSDAFGRSDEASLVDRLREDNAIQIELVVEEGGEILGHVALSQLSSPAAALALAPLAVHPSRQCRGLGARLVRDAVARAGALSTELVFVLGDPGYYERFGFSVGAASGFQCDYSGSHFMVLRLNANAGRSGRVIYPRAFDDL
jgi:putative acetyltransferase